MPLDDAIRRAAAQADGVAAKQQAAAGHQARHLPRAVEATRQLFREAAGAFEAARAKPTHMLRIERNAAKGGLLGRFKPPEDEVQRLQHGWRVNRVFLGSDGRIYRAHGRGTFQVPSLAAAEGSQRWPDAQATRGLLKAGLRPGDDIVVVEKLVGHMFDEIDVRSRMFVAPVELTQERAGHYDLPLGVGDGQDFVAAPDGVIFMKCDGYEHHWYEKLEDVLAAEIVRQRR